MTRHARPTVESFDALVHRTFDHFFRHVHHIPMYSFLHRVSLTSQYATVKVDRPLLLALIGITSCLTDMGPGLRDYGNRCIDDAEALIFAAYSRPSTFKAEGGPHLCRQHPPLNPQGPGPRLHHQAPHPLKQPRPLLHRPGVAAAPHVVAVLHRLGPLQWPCRPWILEFSKDTLARGGVANVDVKSAMLPFDAELDDFANRLPASFKFSDFTLRRRACSPLLCVFVMIHVWWCQCHCDLYRLALADFPESLPPSRLETLDASFIQDCHRQCRDHSLAMATIFSAMQRLDVKPIADLDLALCAYQCARMLKHLFLVDAYALGLDADAINDQASVCLRAIEQCCRGPAAAAMALELGSWVTR
ncbi:Fungal transcriptional regulatory protein [Ophiocordyceps sinensis CO18]|uniref:Fungal transcriptional regulatory protein n=1 Tax=Ophiocordyceps sinensis (strain Co18 / CGMCC 3.14243) TaxID=911162 RepID=T4ZX53_OPHSC|nr:Fungal transcriptional regulatory protein [Ophiocordyceps sinensis CO18]